MNIKRKIMRLASDRIKAAVLGNKLYKSLACYICKKENKSLHGHHEDYTKVLEVIWLCPKCHKAAHKQIQLMNIDILTCSNPVFEILIETLRKQALG